VRGLFAIRKRALPAALACVIALVAAAPAAAALKVTWMAGYPAPGTPAKYDKVGMIKVGSPSARNVLVLEPGTSAAAAYFVPFAKWVTSAAPSWQVWAVQRRESLLEDQSEANLAKEHKVSATQLFDYYLGFLADKRVTHHLKFIPDSTVEFAKQWGMNVAVQDLHRVIGAAEKLGGRVVLGGHSLGGAVVTAYATWDFGGRAGAGGLAGLVYDDSSLRKPRPGCRSGGRSPTVSRPRSRGSST
jgi:pimeloyl-ACP methyl ester carboxylesterase